MAEIKDDSCRYIATTGNNAASATLNFVKSLLPALNRLTNLQHKMNITTPVQKTFM